MIMSTERELREKRDIDYKKLHNGTTFEADKEPETLPKNSNFSSSLQNIKFKNNTT
jgi:hypothetical protein